MCFEITAKLFLHLDIVSRSPHHHCHCSPEGSVDDELGHVDDEPGEVAEEEHDDDADEDRGQVHLVVRGAVPVGPHMGVPAQGGHIKK